jgi:hypothetical protein
MRGVDRNGLRIVLLHLCRTPGSQSCNLQGRLPLDSHAITTEYGGRALKQRSDEQKMNVLFMIVLTMGGRTKDEYW